MSLKLSRPGVGEKSRLSSMVSDLEAFRHDPADGSFAAQSIFKSWAELSDNPPASSRPENTPSSVLSITSILNKPEENSGAEQDGIACDNA